MARRACVTWRCCTIRLKRLASESRDDLLLIEIDPPLPGQKYGLGNRDLDVVVVATRHRDASLFPINEWPVSVHVAHVLTDNLRTRNTVREEELESIAWAELYKSEENARFKTV